MRILISFCGMRSNKATPTGEERFLERVLDDGIFGTGAASSIAIQTSICHHPRRSQDRTKYASNPWRRAALVAVRE